MSDGEGGGDQGQQGGGGGEELGGGGGTPEWMAGLPDDLKADATLARYADVPALAKAAVDLRRQASGRVVVPGEGASEADWNGFYSAIGRPESADKYELPEGVNADVAGAFKPVAFKLGLTPSQAKGLAEFDVQRGQAAIDKWNTDSKAELDAVKAATPDYDAKIAKAKALFKDLGGDPAIAQELDVKLGSGNLVKFFLGLADRAGEHRRVDGEGGGGGGGGVDPDKAMSDKMKDATWRERAKVAGSPENAEYKRLEQAAAAKEQNLRSGSGARA